MVILGGFCFVGKGTAGGCVLGGRFWGFYRILGFLGFFAIFGGFPGMSFGGFPECHFWGYSENDNSVGILPKLSIPGNRECISL